jgi:hypothetical protein
MKARLKNAKTRLLIVVSLVAVLGFGFISLKDKDICIAL